MIKKKVKNKTYGRNLLDLVNLEKVKKALYAKVWEKIDSNQKLKNLNHASASLYRDKMEHPYSENKNDLEQQIAELSKQAREIDQKYCDDFATIENAKTLADFKLKSFPNLKQLTDEQAEMLITWYEENYVQEDEHDDDLEP